MTNGKRGSVKNEIPKVERKQGGVYRISVADRWVHIGANRRLSNVENELNNNMLDLANGEDWHRQRGEPFRRVQAEALSSIENGEDVRIEVLVIENNKEMRNQVKSEFIARHREEEAAGGPMLLSYAERSAGRGR